MSDTQFASKWSDFEQKRLTKVNEGLKAEADDLVMILSRASKSQAKNIANQVEPLNAWVLLDLIYYGMETKSEVGNALLLTFNCVVESHGEGCVAAALANRRPLTKVA